MKWVDFTCGLSDFSKDVRREGEREKHFKFENMEIDIIREEILKSIKIEKFQWDEFSVSIVNKF